ncbi:acetaldehyde dehydrogenase [Streptomyces sp. KLMMK]|uniref:acetaldehyde dehydrogenase n=1 Tax=Streptomyces sp. KLMMK TaxID=3109353 RepID=UPI002FFF40A3
MSKRPQLRAAVIGAGMLGIDLADRLTRSPTMTCALVAGRSTSTTGLRLAARIGCATSTDGIDAVTGADIDVVFDASNAAAHPAHWAALASAGVLLVDLTPSSSGAMVAPTVNGFRAESSRHLSLVSCGGQAVLPVLDMVAQHCVPQYIEVVTTVASASAGRATRLNLDEYIATTEYAVRQLTHVPRAKVMATISPALPAPVFRAEVTVLASDIQPEPLRAGTQAVADAVRVFAPGYEVASFTVDDQRITATVNVTARGGRLPAYAGNVEIINAAAVLLAERYAATREVEAL